MSFTEAQQQAIEETGNLLLVAGAGAGKTKTLVEKCIRYLTANKNRGSLDRVLMVTFTEAAAKEVRERIQLTLEARLIAEPRSQHLQEQLAKLDQAKISTLHGFCNQLVRKHILELNLSPSFRVCSEKTQKKLFDETFDNLFKVLENDRSMESFFVKYCEGKETTFKSLILKLFGYSQSQPFPELWLKNLQLKTQPFESWESLLVNEWNEQGKIWKQLAAEFPGSEKSTILHAALKAASGSMDPLAWNDALQTVDFIQQDGATDKKIGKRFQKAFDDLSFLFHHTGSKSDCLKSLREDYKYHAQSIQELTSLCLEFNNLYKESKQAQGFLDFSDLEQYTLQLLWNHQDNKPSELAAELRKEYDLIFVDEFQDINKVQETIIRALSDQENGQGLFLVGDVKQSIYRFRLADPSIFLDYERRWKEMDSSQGRVISLQENFRSHETILHFVNDVFGHFMKKELGGIQYDQDAELKYSGLMERPYFRKGDSPTEVQIQTWVREKNTGAVDRELGEETENPSEIRIEARNVAHTIRGLVQSGYLVFESNGDSRPVRWSDIAILVSSKKGVIQPLSREFAKAGVPLYAVVGDLFASMECFDLLNLLKLVDNSEQDIPLIGVLRSPIVGLTVEELAEISLIGKEENFWMRCQNFRFKSSKGLETITKKLADFFQKLDHWKSQAPYLSVPELLESILLETHYEWWLQTQPRKDQRVANVQKFKLLAAQFEAEQQGTLYQFLQNIEQQEDLGLVEEPPAILSDNSVHLMTIHQSKGLEFPVVFLPFLGKSWNVRDLSGDMLIDPTLGLCLKIRPPGLSGTYPSFLQFVAKKTERLSTVGEELRKFYVAVTRAKQKLYLSGAVSKAFDDRVANINWPPDTKEIYYTISTAEWLHGWYANSQKAHQLSIPIPNWVTTPTGDQETPIGDLWNSKDAFESLESTQVWKYANLSLTEQAAKTSVTQLKNRAFVEKEEITFHQKLKAPFGVRGADALERGKAFHLLLETMPIDQPVSLDQLQGHLATLLESKALTQEEADSVDLKKIVRFWQSNEGQFARAHHQHVRRELPFTYRLSLSEYHLLLGQTTTDKNDGEFVVLQGIVDLAVITETEIYIVDFKTDRIANSEQLSEKVASYRPQLEMYKKALEEIYKKPVVWTALHFLETGFTHLVQNLVPI